MNQYKYATILTIAGSDSGGGAGIQADLKTFSALGCYGTVAITAVTVQNTIGVTGIHTIPATIVQAQIKAVMDDIQPAAIKIGMVHSTELVVAISETLQQYKNIPIVFDPVMVATSGDKLIEEDTIYSMRKMLFPMATLITPNLDEAAVLVNRKLDNVQAMKAAVQELLQEGSNAILLKGGHLKGEKVFDVFADKQGNEQVFESTFIESKNVHGTGCTLSSAIAAFLSLNYSMEEAIIKAREYVLKAIAEGKNVQTGKGHGPLNHFFDPKKLVKIEL